MCNAATKLLIGVALGATVTSCGGNPDAEAADRLVAQAGTMLDREQWDSAFIYLDSLDRAYPRQIEARRSGMALRPKAIEGATVQEIMELQMLRQATTFTFDSLAPLFTFVPASDDVLEGYYVHRDAPANFRERNTAVARVTPRGEFVMISSLAGRSTHHTGIALSVGGHTVQSGTVPFDPEALLSRESARFASGKADTLGVFAAANDDSRPFTLTFTGGAKQPTATLTAKEVHAIADTWRLASALGALAPINARLEQLNGKLQLARDQSANLPD